MAKSILAKRSISLRLIWLFTLAVGVSWSTTSLYADIQCSPVGGGDVVCVSHPEPSNACETYDLNGYCSFVCQAAEYYTRTDSFLLCDDHGQHDDEIHCRCGIFPEA